MDLKSRRSFEFNKRVRDLVSKDRTQLKEKYDKIDKQRAERLSEIHHMQERVRFAMRNLAKDKLQLKKKETVFQINKETTPGGPSSGYTNEHSDLFEKDVSEDSLQKHHVRSSQTRKNLDIPNLNVSQRHASAPSNVPQTSETGIPKKDHVSKSKSNGFDDIPSKNLDIPWSDTSKRRASAPLSFPQPGSPKARDVFIKPASTSIGRLPLSASLPKELYTSTKRKLSKTLDKSHILSVNDMRMSTRSPVVNLHRKSADGNSRGLRKLSDTSRLVRDISPNQHGNDSRPRSLSVAHVANALGVREAPRKLSGGGPKRQLFRVRSRSLPDLLSPNNSKGSKQSASSPVSKECVESQDISESSLARSFEQLKHCRYLRSALSDHDVTT